MSHEIEGNSLNINFSLHVVSNPTLHHPKGIRENTVSRLAALCLVSDTNSLIGCRFQLGQNQQKQNLLMLFLFLMLQIWNKDTQTSNNQQQEVNWFVAQWEQIGINIKLKERQSTSWCFKFKRHLRSGLRGGLSLQEGCKTETTQLTHSYLNHHQWLYNDI